MIEVFAPHSLAHVQSKISEKLCPVAPHVFLFIFQVNKGVTQINLVDFANQLNAQADQLVRFIFGSIKIIFKKIIPYFLGIT